MNARLVLMRPPTDSLYICVGCRGWNDVSELPAAVLGEYKVEVFLTGDTFLKNMDVGPRLESNLIYLYLLICLCNLDNDVRRIHLIIWMQFLLTLEK